MNIPKLTHLEPFVLTFPRILPPGDTKVPRDELTPVSVESLAPGVI